jgi:hypothetical protein
MPEAAEFEREMVRVVEALGRTVEYLHRHDAERNGAGRSPVTDCAQEGLAAARRVLVGLRTTGHRPRFHRHGDPGE